jgi:hypothetical protein
VRNGIEVIEKCPGRSMDCAAISKGGNITLCESVKTLFKIGNALSVKLVKFPGAAFKA